VTPRIIISTFEWYYTWIVYHLSGCLEIIHLKLVSLCAEWIQIVFLSRFFKAISFLWLGTFLQCHTEKITSDQNSLALSIFHIIVWPSSWAMLKNGESVCVSVDPSDHPIQSISLEQNTESHTIWRIWRCIIFSDMLWVSEHFLNGKISI